MGRSQRHLRETVGGDSSDWPGVAVAAPTINSPSAGANSTSITLTATAKNQTGALAEAFAWSSNVDGFLGRGNRLDVTVTAGAHTITCDCGGVTNTVAITAS